jgi:hypothetical protein
LEGVEGAVEGAAGGIDAPLELAEGLVIVHARLAEGKIVFHGIGFLVGIFEELGFGDAEAAEGPLAADDFVEHDASFGGGGVVAVVELVDQEFEIGEVLGGEDEGFGMDAGFEGVHGGNGLTRDRGGAGGFLGIATIGFYLTNGGHVFRSRPSFARMHKAEPYATLRLPRRYLGIGGEWRQVTENAEANILDVRGNGPTMVCVFFEGKY